MDTADRAARWWFWRVVFGAVPTMAVAAISPKPIVVLVAFAFMFWSGFTLAVAAMMCVCEENGWVK